MGNEHHAGGCPCVLPEGAGGDVGAEPKRHGKRADGADGKSLGQGNCFEENKEQYMKYFNQYLRNYDLAEYIK